MNRNALEGDCQVVIGGNSEYTDGFGARESVLAAAVENTLISGKGGVLLYSESLQCRAS